MRFRLAYKQLVMGDPMLQRLREEKAEHAFDASSDEDAEAKALRFLNEEGEGERTLIELVEVRPIPLTTN